MESRHILYELLQLAFIEIRDESQNNGDTKNIAALSDLFHNLPLALEIKDPDYDVLLNKLIKQASLNQGLSAWVKNNTPMNNL